MDRITALRARRNALHGEMETLLATARDADRDLTGDEQARYDALIAEDDTLGLQLVREEDLERRRAASARPVSPLPGIPGGSPISVPAAAIPAADRGLRAARMLRALAATNGDPIRAASYAEHAWGDGQLFASQSVSVATAGGFLVPEDVSREVIELLRPASVVMSLNPMVVPMPHGNLTMNRVTQGAQASYIGELQNIPETSVAFGQVRLSAKKLAALIGISNDLIRMSDPAADRIVRDDLVAALAQRMDLAFIRGAGTEFSPRGVRNQGLAANVLVSNATTNLANVTVDMGRLRLALRAGNSPMIRPGFLFSPRTEQFLMDLRDGLGNFSFRDSLESNQTFGGYPYRVTTQIPENLGNGANGTEIILADFAQVIVGEHMGITVDVSAEAAYADAGGVMRSAFSRDETVMRAIAQHDIGVRHLSSIAVLTGITWGV